MNQAPRDYEEFTVSDDARHQEFLKERLLREGAHGLSEAEILEILLAFTIPGKDVRPISEDLTARFGGLKEILMASHLELTAIESVRKDSAALLRLVGEIVSRCSEKTPLGEKILGDSRELEQYLLTRMGDMKEENFLLIFLGTHGIVLGEEVVGAGSINQVVLFPRQVMERSLRYNAASLIVVHNHPNGPPIPSIRDREEAERLREILLPFDIRVLDSIVVGHNVCFSIFKNCPLQQA
jgi:DNA repair protein RadC